MPDAVAAGPLHERVRAVVAKYSKLADAIVRAQCKAVGRAPESISHADLPTLAANIGRALGMFTSPEKGRAAAEEIRRLG